MLYKIGATHAECQQFYGMICPAQEGAPSTGDVPVPMIILWGFDPNPDPTEPSKPANVYSSNPGVWFYNVTSNPLSALAKYSNAPETPLSAPGPAPAAPMGGTIGIHISGQDIKGPEEAEVSNLCFQSINQSLNISVLLHRLDIIWLNVL